MSRETTLVILGILIMLVQFIGLPLSWRLVIVPLLGLAVLLIGITLRARRLPAPAAPAPQHEEAQG